jgi:uncharacterized protein YndB with AHSA1/START domain
MPGSRTATCAVIIDADPATVWAALTDADVLGEAFFGSKIQTDWQVGSPITYSGEYDGKTYEDKGEIVEVVPNQRLVATHWSPLSGTSDEPANYSKVTYGLAPHGSGTELSVSQNNVDDPQSQEHYESNWKKMLNALKRLVER